MKLITLFLTCRDREEANKITEELLDKKLAACVRLSDVNSSYWWKGGVENANEKLLIIDSAEEKFNEIETAVKNIHSYKTFVLTAHPVIRASNGVAEWVKESLN